MTFGALIVMSRLAVDRRGVYFMSCILDCKIYSKFHDWRFISYDWSLNIYVVKNFP